ncbi:hypothetical protein ACTWP4_21505 [Gracilibacillus sp. D59]|uniref:hypothetical protein n=1 Tax=Gracilibacillus sp. D59 TaxID=3457434 RepID=UPI003FCC4DE0
MGTARAEDPLGKAVFFTKLAEAVPMESEVFCRSGGHNTPFKKGWKKANPRQLYFAVYIFSASFQK